MYDVCKLLSHLPELAKWKFLTTWTSLDDMEKLKKYDKFYSHEMNLFLWNKDREFFEGVVKPLLQNKKEKQVIDYVLLEDEKNLKKLCCLSKLSKFNKLELVLLGQAAFKFDKGFAQALLKYLKQRADLQKVKPQQ